MIVVTLTGNRWTWALIAACGRALVHAGETYATDFAANDAAREWRRRFFIAAGAVDHRQGACL